MNEDNKTSNTNQPLTDRQIQTPSKSIQNCNEMNKNIQRRYQERTRNKGLRNKDPKKKTKPAGLTLLEILCGEFENGTLLGKRTERIQEKKESDRDCCASNVTHGRTKKAQTAGKGQESLLTDSEKSLKLAKEASSKARSYTSKSSCEVFQSGHGESEGNLNCNTPVVMSKIAGTEGFYSSDSPKESSASEMGISSEETVALRCRSAQNLNSTSGDLIITNHKIELENQTTSRQFCEGIHSKLDDRSTSLGTTTKIESGSPILSSDYPSRLTESSLGVKTPESCRFVHFKEQRKISKRKSKKENCLEKSRGKEKLNRTRSLGVKLFQFDGLQFPQKGISKVRLALENSQHFTTPHWFPRKVTSEERAQKFPTDDVSLPRSG